ATFVNVCRICFSSKVVVAISALRSVVPLVAKRRGKLRFIGALMRVDPIEKLLLDPGHERNRNNDTHRTVKRPEPQLMPIFPLVKEMLCPFKIRFHSVLTHTPRSRAAHYKLSGYESELYRIHALESPRAIDLNQLL